MINQNKLSFLKKKYRKSVKKHKRTLSRKSISSKFDDAQIKNERLNDLVLKFKKKEKNTNLFKKLENNLRNSTIEGRSKNKRLQKKLNNFKKIRNKVFSNSFQVNYLKKDKFPSKKENIYLKTHCNKLLSFGFKKRRKNTNIKKSLTIYDNTLKKIIN